MTATSPQKPNSNRLPAPALFVGPPSRNASNTSLAQPGQTHARLPITRQRSHLSTDPKRGHSIATNTTSTTAPNAPSAADGDILSLTPTNASTPFTRRQRQAADAADAEASSHAEAVWAEMQNKLEEVELSDLKRSGGKEHERALDALRKAQIELAKAWARSEGDEDGEEDGDDTMLSQESGAGDTAQKKQGSTGEGSGSADGKESVNESTTGLEGSMLEEETEKDIELSRRRREANDRYFEKVNKGVLEVVMKLEEVAAAMKSVELESKEIWRGSDSMDTASVKTTTSAS